MKKVSECIKQELNLLPIARVPAASVRFPRSETHPAELHLARRVLTSHVVAAAVLLDRHLEIDNQFRNLKNSKSSEKSMFHDSHKYPIRKT